MIFRKEKPNEAEDYESTPAGLDLHSKAEPGNPDWNWNCRSDYCNSDGCKSYSEGTFPYGGEKERSREGTAVSC